MILNLARTFPKALEDVKYKGKKGRSTVSGETLGKHCGRFDFIILKCCKEALHAPKEKKGYILKGLIDKKLCWHSYA